RLHRPLLRAFRINSRPGTEANRSGAVSPPQPRLHRHVTASWAVSSQESIGTRSGKEDPNARVCCRWNGSDREAFAVTARRSRSSGDGDHAEPRQARAAATAAGVERFITQSYTGWTNIREGGPVKTEEDALDPSPAKAQAE